MFFENIQWQASGRGYYSSTAHDMISSSATKNIEPSQFVSTEEKPCQFPPAYNLYFHLGIVILSFISIVISIFFK